MHVLGNENPGYGESILTREVEGRGEVDNYSAGARLEWYRIGTYVGEVRWVGYIRLDLRAVWVDEIHDGTNRLRYPKNNIREERAESTDLLSL